MSEKKDVLVPTVHLNGSSGAVLKDNLMEAIVALQKAMEAMRGCEPNDRDYYPQGACSGQLARKEHQERVELLRDVQRDLYLIVEGVQDQLDARAKR